jgi:hypothetical protein
MTTPTQTEIKLAKFIQDNLPALVIKAGTHPIFCKLNLHNNKLLKTINTRASLIYKMSRCSDDLVKAPYEFDGETKVDNALLAIRALLQSDRRGYSEEYIVKRIGFLVDEALQSYYDVSHQSWVERVHSAIHEAKKEIIKKTKVKTKKPIKAVVKKKSIKVKKPVKRVRNSKGQFIEARKRK